MVGGRELASIPVRSQQTGFDRQERVALDRCDFSCIFLISVFELTFIPCLYFRCIGSWSTYCFGCRRYIPFSLSLSLSSLSMHISIIVQHYDAMVHVFEESLFCIWKFRVVFALASWFFVSTSCWLSLNIPVTYVGGISFGR